MKPKQNKNILGYFGSFSPSSYSCNAPLFAQNSRVGIGYESFQLSLLQIIGHEQQRL